MTGRHRMQENRDRKRNEWRLETDMSNMVKGMDIPITVTVKMNGATELPAEILFAIAGRDIELILEFPEGRTCTINGNSMK